MSGHAYTATVRPARSWERGRPAMGSPRSALAVAGLLAIGLATLWLLAELVPAVRFKDAVVLYDFTTLGRPSVNSLSDFVLRLVDPVEFVLGGVALLAVALATGRTRVALAVGVVLALAPSTAEILKPLLAHRHDHVGGAVIGPASWPSGHSTAATALALCAVLVAPPRLRLAVALLGALFVTAVGVSLLVMSWHMPSDVLGGILLGGLWMALAVAALRASEHVRPNPAADATPAAR